MARAPGDPDVAGEGARSSGEEEVPAAEVDRINAKLERLSAQRRALRKAMRQFGEDFDARVWADAFASPDPDAINRVFAVTGGYLALLNNTVEAVRVGAKLAGVKPAEGMLGASGLIEAIRIEGGFSDRQAQTFIELYHTRNGLQHASPGVEADEVHRQVRLLLRHLPRFVESYVNWLKGHDIEL
jgi:hypothetical protein